MLASLSTCAIVVRINFVDYLSTMFLMHILVNLVLIHLGLYIQNVAAKIQFLSQPHDTTEANEGGIGLINCVVVNRRKDTQTFAWVRSGKIITMGNQIQTDGLKNPNRFKLDLISKLDRYALVIEPVERSDDEYTFTCRVYENSEIILSSTPTKFKIKQMPGTEYPAFEPLKEKYNTGDIINIICYTELTALTISTLELYKDDVKLQPTRSGQDEQHQKIEYSFIAIPADNAQSFRCQLTHTLLSVARNRTTGLVNIEFKPNVSIYEPEEVHENKEAIFICRKDANPNTVSFAWDFSHPNSHVLKQDEYKIDELSQQILRIKKPNSINNGTRLKCSVTNTVGSGYSIAILNVLKQPTPPKPFAQPTTTVPGSNFLPSEMTLAIIIAAAGGCSVLIILIIILPMYYRYLKNCLFQPNLDVTGSYIAQPDIYFEPKDSIRPPLPTPDHVEQWRISVGIQVSPESNEHNYTEVGGNSSKGSDQIYGASIHDAATATYRSKSVYV